MSQSDRGELRKVAPPQSDIDNLKETAGLTSTSEWSVNTSDASTTGIFQLACCHVSYVRMGSKSFICTYSSPPL